MTAVCETFGVARSNIAERVKQRPAKTRGRPPLADHDLVDEIKAIITDMPTYGYRRVHAILRRKASSERRSWPNAKRIHRVMKVHGLLLQRHTVQSTLAATTAVLLSSNRTCAGVLTVSKSAAITKRGPRCLCSRLL